MSELRQSSATTSAITVRPSRWQRRALGSRREVAEYLGLPPSTLNQWAYKSFGPPFKIIGRHARYDWDLVERWVEAQRTGGDDAA